MSKHGTIPLTHSLARKEWSGSPSSAGSSLAYHVIPQHYNQVVESGGEWTPPPPPIPPQHLVYQHHHHHLHQHRLSSHHSRTTSSRPVTPQTGETTAVLPCGGHCVLFERFCHRCLQVSFVGGILSGCILTGAGLLGSPEVGVLAYIGGLTALVSGLLLAVQSRAPKRRRAQAPSVGLAHHRREEIPLRQIRPPPSPSQDFREESGIPWWRRENMD